MFSSDRQYFYVLRCSRLSPDGPCYKEAETVYSFCHYCLYCGSSVAHAQFFAAVHVIVYAGADHVAILYVSELTHRALSIHPCLENCCRQGCGCIKVLVEVQRWREWHRSWHLRIVTHRTIGYCFQDIVPFTSSIFFLTL